MKFLEQLVAVRGASSDEGLMKEFVLSYIEKNKSKWTVMPEVIEGAGFQDCIILTFGKPTTAIYAHMDSIGFSVGYGNELIKIGGPRLLDGINLVGSDSQGEIEAQLMVIDDENDNQSAQYIFEREIDRGTILTFKPNFRITDKFVQSPYMDNRLGVWNALKVAETLEDGAIVFYVCFSAFLSASKSDPDPKKISSYGP